MQNQELAAIFTEDGFIIDTNATKDKNYYFDQDVWDRFQSDKYNALYHFGFFNRNPHMTPSLAFLHYLSNQFVNELSMDSDIEITRKAKPARDAVLQDALRAIPYATGAEYINILWIQMIWNALSNEFEKEILAYDGSVSDYLHDKNNEINVVGRVFFHLVENKDETFPFAFLATYSTGDKQKVGHMPLKNALLEYKGKQDQLISLLSTVSKTADRSEFISELVENGELFSPLKFDVKEAHTFLKEIPLYEECGVVCRIPDWWKKKGNAKLSVSIGEKNPSGVGMDALMDFNPKIHLNDAELTREEVESLLSQTSGLSFIKGKWVEVDHEKLTSVLKAFDQVNAMGEVTFAEAIRMQLNVSDDENAEYGTSVEITQGTWMQNMIKRLSNPSATGHLPIGKDFKAVLRHYQQTGFHWLHSMKSMGFGALLADDMGLGKTVQILALLEYLRQNGGAKTLLILPASLLCNWQKEADRFTPKLSYTVIHTSNREFSLKDADLFLTTYGMVMRLESLREIDWDLIILDEAQAIKNAGTKQTRAIKELRSHCKIAMTGTPIENRLSDLWSIFDFLNKGLLGSAKEFAGFTKALSKDVSGYSKLRDIVSPFLLRRLKTDKSVISDLPEKVEVKAYATLTKKQVVLYNALIKDLELALKDASGIARKGLVLSGIMKFKQICNHPDQYLGQNGFDTKHSGKYDKLVEICQTILEKRERVLVFTQFKELTDPLQRFLETIFERKGLVLHGGTPVKKRGELVETFNGEKYVPFMVLSLKAGGVGLNLTGANHVIHFDRWWNPAIESQATDRAFRIGQKKNVMVYKFITAGTIEEKIDVMLEEKQRLADDVISTSKGENWITEMSNEELMDLFTLTA